MSGGVLPCSASGTLVWNCSFWIGSIVNETSGWVLWKSSAICCQIVFIGSVVRLCHQVSVTGPSVEASPPPEPLHAASKSVAAAAKATDNLCTERIGSTPDSVGRVGRVVTLRDG